MSFSRHVWKKLQQARSSQTSLSIHFGLGIVDASTDFSSLTRFGTIVALDDGMASAAALKTEDSLVVFPLSLVSCVGEQVTVLED